MASAPTSVSASIHGTVVHQSQSAIGLAGLAALLCLQIFQASLSTGHLSLQPRLIDLLLTLAFCAGGQQFNRGLVELLLADLWVFRIAPSGLDHRQGFTGFELWACRDRLACDHAFHGTGGRHHITSDVGLNRSFSEHH